MLDLQIGLNKNFRLPLGLGYDRKIVKWDLRSAFENLSGRIMSLFLDEAILMNHRDSRSRILMPYR